MHPSVPRLLRILPRSAVVTTEPGATKLPKAKIFEELPKDVRKPPSLLEVLLKRKKEAGASYPPNIRIEPVMSRQTFAGVAKEVRASLRATLRER